ncbi:MAG: hypothetical protein F9K21_00440 [Rhodocyclaceae bacterium]|nr:MAG: hypothetical protein F9K21_00440 [Rhodocyclaceae bacterium]CAG0926937.1 hypothetical protein RHDC3_00226 [Rhodocyclaceae bacterium]
MSTDTNSPEPDPDIAGITRPLATPAFMGYQAPAAPASRQADMTAEEIEAAFDALWRKLERCE